MTRKLALSIVFAFLGLATWDAFLGHEDVAQRVTTSAQGQLGDDGIVHKFDGGDGFPPKP